MRADQEVLRFCYCLKRIMTKEKMHGVFFLGIEKDSGSMRENSHFVYRLNIDKEDET